MKILFVCTGNTCRSPMAQGIFQKMLEDRGIKGVECSSAGLFASTGAPASAYAIEAAERFGVDISAHRARRITKYLLDETDLFVCMTAEHASSLTLYVDREKILVPGSGISDPYGAGLEQYLICANEIKTALAASFDSLIGGKNEA